MKVKVMKSGLPTYWYADKIGKVFEVVQAQYEPYENRYLIVEGTYKGEYLKEADVEIMKEVQSNTSAFDMKKEAWFIRIPTPEISKLVQEWLFEQGFEWRGKQTTYLPDVYDHYKQVAAVGHVDFGLGSGCQIDYAGSPLYEMHNIKEITFSFKTIIDSVEYPVVETQQDKQIRELEQTIAKASEQIKALRGEGE